MKILLVVAMKEEIEPIRQAMDAQSVDQINHVSIEQGTYQGHDLYLVESGIGKANAAMATAIGMERFAPDLVLNYGVVGGISSDIQPGDVVVPNDFCYWDADDTAFGSPLGRVPRMPRTYPLDPQLKDLLDQLVNMAPNIKTGQVLTSDAFLYRDEQIQFVKEHFPKGKIVEMEATAIAQVAYTYELPFLAIKTLSDHSDQEEAPQAFLNTKGQAAQDGVTVLLQAMKLLNNY